jgi:soluble lytic murein transglycosylase
MSCTPTSCTPTFRRLALLFSLGLLLLARAGTAAAQTSAMEDTVLQAREALRNNNKPQLAAAARTLAAAGHPLAQWAEYWDLSSRLAQAQHADLDAFYARWPGTYVEDRLRNDWLLELGKRRDWTRLRAELPLYRMNDDREVACYGLLLQHLEGQDVAAAARSTWFAAQKSLDDGCALLAQTLVEARVLNTADVWQAMRLAVEANRARAARTAAPLLGPAVERAVADVLDKPAVYLAKPAGKRAAVDVSTRGSRRLARQQRPWHGPCARRHRMGARGQTSHL